MAYIGKTPITGNFVKLDAISVVNGQAAYTMNNGGSAFTDYENVNQFLVSLNGILQAPTDSFTVSGSTLTFASNLATGDVIDFVIVLGNTLDIGTPSDATVTNAKTNFVSTSSAAGLQIKGDSTTPGTLQLNCEQNSHGVKLRSPAHSSGQSYTLTLPTGNVTADKFLKVASVSGSGTTGIGQLSFADAGGAFTLLQTQTVSSGVSSVNFTSNIDSTYKNYMIQITECHPADDGQRFNFRVYSSEGSPDSGSAYRYGGIGKRSDNTATDHNSTGTNQGQITCDPVGNAAAESFSATIYLYNPSGTTFYKNIDVNATVMNASGHVIMNRSANNYNETVAYTGISFFFDSGNIDSGVFKLFGIS